MYKYSLLLITALTVLSCTSQNNALTEKEFTQKYSDSLSARFPDAKFEIIDNNTIESKYKGNTIRILADNAFSDYQSTPDSLRKVLNKYVTVASQLFSPKELISQDNIVPIIKPIEYLNDIQEIANNMGAKKEVETIYEKYNDELIIAYAEDSKSSIRYLTATDMKTLAIDKDSLRSIATRNLDRLLTNINGKGGDGMYMVTAGGDYEASIILLDNIITKQTFPVNGDFVIAIPTRDILLITGSNEIEKIAKIREAAKDSYETGNYKISPLLFKWNGKKFEKFTN